MSDERDGKTPEGAPGETLAETQAPLREGKEAPPPGTRIAAVVRWGLVVAMALVALGSVASYAGFSVSRGGSTAAAQVHYCPMHPQIVQDGPGTCPICNMNLVPKPAGPVKASPTMTPAAATSEGGDAAAAGKYHCPMHPEVTSDDPNATCAKCGGMKLLPRPTAVAGVPGLTPIEVSDARVQLIGMRTAKASRRSVGSALTAVGVVTASERGQAQINTRFSGFVEKLLVSETGVRVRRGQTLATVYSPEVLRVQQELVTARRWTAPPPVPGAAAEHHPLGHALDEDARRRLELLGISPQEIETVMRTGKPMPAIPIRSPVDGYIVGKNVVVGAAVAPGTPLFEVADLTKVWVIADVYETDFARVRVGQTARLALAAFPGETFTGKVQFVHPTLDPGTRTLRLRIEFPNRPGAGGPKLRPGMYGNVALDQPTTEALAIPAEALVDTGEVQYVFVAVGGGRYEPRRVTPGARIGDGVEILSGLTAGETVVTTANFLLDSESRLQAAMEGKGAAPAGTAPAGTAPAGTAPAGTAPAGTAPAGTAPAGTAPASGGAPASPPTTPGHQH